MRNKKRLRLVLLFQFIISFAFGQDTIQPPTYQQSHFFQAINLSIATDNFQSPVFKTINYPDGHVQKYNTRGISIVSVTYDIRFNLKDYGENASWSLNMPFTFGISAVLSDTVTSTSDVGGQTN